VSVWKIRPNFIQMYFHSTRLW